MAEQPNNSLIGSFLCFDSGEILLEITDFSSCVCLQTSNLTIWFPGVDYPEGVMEVISHSHEF